MTFFNGAVTSHVDHAVQGHAVAGKTLDSIARGVVHPDTLYQATMDVWSDHGPDGLVTFARRIQKELERVAA